MQSLFKWDLELFRLINYEWNTDFLDWLMPLLRNAYIWIPLYLFLILLIVINYRITGWWWVLFAAITGILTDFVSSTLIKENIIRLRPCNDPALADWVRVLVAYRPQSSSFTSSHACNHFGIAMFLYITLKKEFGKWPFLFFIWALSIVYAQMYVGVHYPIDIICGATIGILIGYLSGRLFTIKYGLA